MNADRPQLIAKNEFDNFVFNDGLNDNNLNVPPRSDARNEKKLKKLMETEKYMIWKNRTTSEYYDDLLDEAQFTYMLRPQEYNDAMKSYMYGENDDDDEFK